MRSPEERAAARAARAEARLIAGTTRHLELPVSPDEALVLLKEAVERRKPMMRLLNYRGDHADVSVAAPILGGWGTGGNLGAAATATGRAGIAVRFSWAPYGDGGTQYTGHAESVSAMFVTRSEIQSVFRALEDAWDARERWARR